MTQEKTIKVEWVDYDKNYLLWSFAERWSAQDYFDSLNQLWSAIDSTNTPTRLLVDLRKSKEHPSNLTTLMQSAFRIDACTLEQAVVISPYRFWERVFSIVRKRDVAARQLSVTFVETFAEAEEHFAQADS